MGICSSNDKTVDNANSLENEEVKSIEQDASNDFQNEMTPRPIKVDNENDINQININMKDENNDNNKEIDDNVENNDNNNKVDNDEEEDDYYEANENENEEEEDDDDDEEEEEEENVDDKLTARPETINFAQMRSTDKKMGKKGVKKKKNVTKRAVVNVAAAKRAKEEKAAEEARVKQRRASIQKKPSRNKMKQNSNRSNESIEYEDDEDINPAEEPQSVMEMSPPPKDSAKRKNPGARLYQNAIKLREKQKTRRRSVEIQAKKQANSYKKKTNRPPKIRRSITDLSAQKLTLTEEHLLAQFRNVDFFSLENAKHKNRVVVPMKAQRWLVKVVKPANERQLRSAVFQTVEGLVGNVEGSISLACVNYPDAYLRHEEGRIKLRRLPKEEPLNWRKEATWRVRRALNDDPLFVSFESVSKPEWFIHVDNFVLVLKKRNNASETSGCFRVVPSVIDMADEDSWDDDDDNDDGEYYEDDDDEDEEDYEDEESDEEQY